MIRCIGVFAAALLCAGCGHFVDVTARNHALQSAEPTYAGVAELPFEKIDFPSDHRFSIDEKNPVLDFGDADQSDKSYVKGFELPVRDGEYQLTMRSYLLRDGLFNPAMYFPVVDLLDDEKKPVRPPAGSYWKSVLRRFSDEWIYSRERWQEYTLRVTPSLRIRYIVVHTRRYLIEGGGMVWVPSDAPPQLAAGTTFVPIFIPSGSSSGPITVEGSVVGDLRIHLEEIPR